MRFNFGFKTIISFLIVTVLYTKYTIANPIACNSLFAHNNLSQVQFNTKPSLGRKILDLLNKRRLTPELNYEAETSIKNNHYYIKFTPGRYSQLKDLVELIHLYPNFFKKYEIYALNELLILPTTQRLNEIIKQMRIENDPTAPNFDFYNDYDPELTSEKVFISNIIDHKIPKLPISIKGSNYRQHSVFAHDWAIHMLAYLLLPKQLTHNIQMTFIKAMTLRKAFKSNKKITDYIDKKLSLYVLNFDIGTAKLRFNLANSGNIFVSEELMSILVSSLTPPSDLSAQELQKWQAISVKHKSVSLSETRETYEANINKRLYN